MYRYNPDYIHHQKGGLTSSLVRELVFGMEDGMVSTLGAIIGIAISTQNHFFVVLAGCVVVSVESISMAAGSYLSNKSEQTINKRILHEEKTEIDEYPEEEKAEMRDLFVKDGWPSHLADLMATEAGKNKKLMLKEMAYRELNLASDVSESALKKALIMGTSYIVGGLIPLVSFLFLDVSKGLFVSIPLTMFALFLLGVYTTVYSKIQWWKAGLEMMGLATVAGLIGYLVGQFVNYLPH